jgi:alpha-1,2-mannosyltransferase
LGQFNALLAILLTAAWAADRRGWGALAGAAIGTAAAVKLFPAFLLLYLIAARRWRAAGVAVVVGGVISAVAAVALGTDAYLAYAADVVPAVSARYAAQWNNLSLSAFWLRLFDPTPESRVVALWAAPTVGKGLAAASRLVVVVLVGWAARRATTTEARDRAFALAVVGMVLVSPIAWPHYLIVLVVPVGLLVTGLARTPWRWALLACLAVMWLPDTLVPKLILGHERAELMSLHRHPPLTPAENLLIASVPHYALLGLFLLTLRLPVGPAEPAGADGRPSGGS